MELREKIKQWQNQTIETGKTPEYKEIIDAVEKLKDQTWEEHQNHGNYAFIYGTLEVRLAYTILENLYNTKHIINTLKS